MEANVNQIQTLNHPAIVLVGVTGTGKSTFGNRLYQFLTGNLEDIFKVGEGLSSETESSKNHIVKIEGKEYELIDTPGIFDSSYTNDHVTAEITSTIQKCAYGVQAVLFVLEYGRLKPHEKEALYLIMRFFGDDVKTNMVLVFSKTVSAKMTVDRTLIERELFRDLPVRGGKNQMNEIKELLLCVNSRWVISPNFDIFGEPNDPNWIREANMLTRHIASLKRPYTTNMFERIRNDRECKEEEQRLAKEKEQNALRELRDAQSRIIEEANMGKIRQQDLEKMLWEKNQQMKRAEGEAAQRLEEMKRENERMHADMVRNEVELKLRRGGWCTIS